MTRTQRGFTLSGALMGMVVLALAALFAAKLLPSYIEYYAVQKILKAMETTGDTKGTVQDIRRSFDRRNAIEDVKSVVGDDLDITKEGGEAVVTATWSTKVPIIGNFSACLDFSVTTAK
ncbi:MAG TPA: DUF4845 domain-containing protein [Usitatibacteraceae bacterium]|nr:DUF4845 domain-containing protein [Usitatibacteraceae bacterium]